MKRRLLLALLWTSIALILIGLYLFQKEKADTDSDRTTEQITGTFTGVKTAPKNADYTLSFVVGAAGVVGVVAAGSALKRS